MLFRAKTLSIIDKAKEDLLQGYYVDSERVNIFTYVGKNSNGIPKWRVNRGTNALEGFHRHIRDLLRRHRMSPQVAYHVLQGFIAQWNMNHNSSHPIPSYRQDLLERINILSFEMNNAQYFPHLKCTYEVQDTGERFGVLPINGVSYDSAIFREHNGDNDLDCDDDEIDILANTDDANDENENADNNVVIESLPVSNQVSRQIIIPRFMKSLDWLFWKESMDSKIGYSPITKDYEKRRFAEHLFAYVGRGEHGNVDFVTMAIDWCAFVDHRERGLTNNPIFYRKTSFQLEDYFNSKNKSGRIFNTLFPIRDRLEDYTKYAIVPISDYNINAVTVRSHFILFYLYFPLSNFACHI